MMQEYNLYRWQETNLVPLRSACVSEYVETRREGNQPIYTDWYDRIQLTIQCFTADILNGETMREAVVDENSLDIDDLLEQEEDVFRNGYR